MSETILMNFLTRELRLQSPDYTYPERGDVLTIVNDAGLVTPQNTIVADTLTLAIDGVLTYNGADVLINNSPIASGGSTGPTGPTGGAGPVGVLGPTGPTNGGAGPTGSSGPAGAVGVAGTAGLSGHIGSTGATGLSGNAGPTGSSGGTIPVGSSIPPVSAVVSTIRAGGFFSFGSMGVPPGDCILRGTITPNGPISASPNAYIQVDLFSYATSSVYRTLSVTYIPVSTGPGYSVDRIAIKIDTFFNSNLYELRVYMVNCSIYRPIPFIPEQLTYTFTYLMLP